jgi:hypothetical protein
MNTQTINKILKRLSRDISKLQLEINKMNNINTKKQFINETPIQKNISSKHQVIECDDKYVKYIIRNGGL